MQNTSVPTRASEGLSKKTYLLRKASYFELIVGLRPLLGYPLYHEELVIYFHSEDHLQFTLAQEHLEWSWTDETRDRSNSDLIRLNCAADLGSLKNKLIFLAKMGGNECDIFRIPVFTFARENEFRLEVRGEGLNGETATLLKNNRSRVSDDHYDLTQIVEVSVEKYERSGTMLPAHARDSVVRRIGDQYFINTRILEFCDDKGILAQINGRKTYRDILQSKNNDYSCLAEIFARLTGVPLLSTDEHCDLPTNQKVTTSLIIPCYNVDSTILTTLTSIAAQDLPETYFQNLEVILVDDGSRIPLETLLRGKEFNFKLKVLRLSENHGVSHARSIGVSESRGAIVIFCDGDLALSRHYLRDHLARNLIITNAVFLSFRENVKLDDPRLTPTAIASGVALPNYTGDRRVIQSDALPNMKGSSVRPLEDTNYFKAFHGSRKVGGKRLTNMVYGHNCSARRELILAAAPFDQRFIGWGKEDIYFALKMISTGNFVIPVLSSGVLHIDHPPRSGSVEAKEREYRLNGELMERILDELSAESIELAL